MLGVSMKKIVLLLMPILLALTLTSCVDGKNVYVFGDSLIVQSADSLRAQAPGINITAFGGTAVCDWTTQMKAVADKHPRMTIASFVGNAGNCLGPAGSDTYWNNMFWSVGDISKYYADHHVPLYWAGYPVGGTPTIYPYVAQWSRVQSNYQFWAAQFPQYVRWFDAGLTIAPNHQYTLTVGGKVVRQPDKLHLTPDGASMYATELLKPAA
jgi:hypothetical protein